MLMVLLMVIFDSLFLKKEENSVKIGNDELLTFSKSLGTTATYRII
jgi:hypothetical protein